MNIPTINSKLLLSGASIAAAAALAIGATFAFFSDTETSTGNIFTSGAIDLKIDNTSYLNSGVEGDMELVPNLTWGLRNITNELFFNYSDLKPGDLGEDTVSIHVFDNDAWACVNIDVTKNDDATATLSDEDCTEPELADDPTCSPPAKPDGDLFDGDLAQNLEFIFWVDDGDNVFEQVPQGPTEQILTQGLASAVLNDVTWALADSNENNVGGNVGDPLTGSNTYYIGKAWCYGDLDTDPEVQDGPVVDIAPPDGIPDNGPDARSPGVTCNGQPVNNASQTDELMGDISFKAEQWKNNPDFQCQPT